MEFALSPDQQLLQQSLAKALDKAASLERVREAAAAKNTCPDALWDTLAEFGVQGLLIAEEWGGPGLSILDAALASEMLGRSVAPAPFIGAAVMAPIALQMAGSPAQQRAWLPKLASGKARAGVAVSHKASGARDGASVKAKGGKLDGKALFALDAAGADILIVADDAGGLHIVEARAAEIVPLGTIDATRSVSEIRFSGAAGEPLPEENAAALRKMIDAGRVMCAADTLGAGALMLEKAVAYAQTREQFGRVIGSFQAVKHMCAEMAAQLEPARSLIWYAAHAFEAAPDEASRMACHAKAHISEVGTFVARTATEVHGGIGMTDLLGLHYWFKRIGLNRQLLGGPERLRAEAAALQGWSKAP